MQTSESTIRQIEPKLKPGLFFMCLCFLYFGYSLSFAELTERRPVVEEMSKEEKKSMIKQLLAEGDRLVENKDYNSANATYESVFLVEPGNIGTSKRIDRLRKIMVKEGVSETQLVTRVYDQEIDIRVKRYLKQAKDFMKQGKLGQARFNLQKLLLIDPLHDEANKRYKEVNQKLEHAA